MDLFAQRLRLDKLEEKVNTLIAARPIEALPTAAVEFDLGSPSSSEDYYRISLVDFRFGGAGLKGIVDMHIYSLAQLRRGEESFSFRMNVESGDIQPFGRAEKGVPIKLEPLSVLAQLSQRNVAGEDSPINSEKWRLLEQQKTRLADIEKRIKANFSQEFGVVAQLATSEGLIGKRSDFLGHPLLILAAANVIEKNGMDKMLEIYVTDAEGEEERLDAILDMDRVLERGSIDYEFHSDVIDLIRRHGDDPQFDERVRQCVPDVELAKIKFILDNVDPREFLRVPATIHQRVVDALRDPREIIKLIAAYGCSFYQGDMLTGEGR